MGKSINRIKRTSPSLHLLLIVVIFALAILGYVAVIASGQLRGYDASKLAAARDLALFLPIIGVFFWLTRRQKFRGEMLPMTAAIFLFAVGLLLQYRVFMDPEYGGEARAKARQA